ncbi:MAG: tetratricopeptide repeat protein [Elusimicrobiota bacterium]
MIFSWQRLVSFFFIIALVAWLLYPNEYFLGLMHKREPDRTVSIEFFKDYLDKHPHHKGASRALARAYEENADPESAIEVMRDLYEHRRGDERIGRENIELLERAGDLERAQAFRWELFQDLKDKGAVDRRGLEWMLFSYYQEAQLVQDEAAELKVLKALVGVAKEPDSFRWALARYHMLHQEYKELLSMLKRTLRDEPGNFFAWEQLIDVYRARRDVGAALAAVADALRKHPDHPDLLARRVSIRVSAERFEDTLADLRRLISLQPGQESFRKMLAYNTLRAGRFDEAVGLYREEIERNPDDSGSWEDLIGVFTSHKRHREAAKELLRYLRRFPDDDGARDDLVAQYDQLGEKAAAAEALREVVARRPDDVERSLDLAYRLFDLGRSNEGVAIFVEYLKRRPDDLERSLDLAYQLFDMKRPDEAVAIFVDYLERRPDDLKRSLELAYRLIELGRFDDAAARFGAYLERRPDDRKIWWELIYSHVDRERDPEAAALLRRYVERFPDDSEAYDLISYVDGRRGEKFASIAPLKGFVARKPDNEKLARLLAGLLNESGRMDEAAGVYEVLIARQDSDKQLWRDVIYGFADRKRYPEAVAWLERFTKRFPDDPKGFEQLVYLHQTSGDHGKAVDVLKDYVIRHPEDEDKARALVDMLVYRERYPEAEAFLLERLKAAPKEAAWLTKLAQVYSYSGRPAEAAEYYRRSIDRSGETPELLKQLGANALFSADHRTAFQALRRAVELSPEDGEVLYYLAETEFARGHPDAGRRWARRALEKMPPGTDPLAERRRLRLEGKLGWSEGIERRYRALAEQRPEDPDVVTDWIDGLLAGGRADRAEEPLALLAERFPERERSRRLYAYEVAVRGGDWERAASSLEGWIEREPEDAPVRRLLGEAYYHGGRWVEAEATLEGLPCESKEECHTAELLWQIRDRYGKLPGATFRYYNLPGDTSYRSGLVYRGYASRDLGWEADAGYGSYRVDSRGFSQGAADGEVRVRYEGRRPFRLGLSGAVSAGAPRDTVSPGVSLRYEPAGGPRLGVEYRYRRFWNDFALPVAAGSVADEARLEVEARVRKRIYLQGQYLYNHYQEGGGGQTDRHQLIPGAGVVLLEGGGHCGRPYLSTGYQLFLEEAAGDEAFFRQVPLIRKSRSHCWNVSYNQWWRPGRVHANVYGYTCVDGTRSLGPGELFGFASQVRFVPASWLRVLAGYEYGQESALGVTGQSHTVTLKLEAPWDGRRQEDLPDR